jgi:hypothetical protein
VPFFRRVQIVARVAALVAALLIGADETDARLAGGLSFGAGSGAFMLLASAAAVETADSRHAAVATAQVGSQTYPGGTLSGFFNRGGLVGGFAAGFLGSGLLGLLFGRGLFGGLGSVPSYLGLIFQLAVLAALCRLIWARWRAGDAAGLAALSPRQLADPYLRSRDDLHAGLDRPAGDGDTRANGQTPGTQTPGTRPPQVTDINGPRD